MPQSLLIDVNTGFITYRRELLSSLKSRNYDFVYGSLFSMNAELKEEYRITIDNAIYGELTKPKTLAKCGFCTNEEKHEEMNIYQMLLTHDDAIVMKKTHEKVWGCSKCQEINILKDTEFTKKVLPKPHYLKVIPEPPARKEGLLDRTTYHKKVTEWALTFLNELEASAQKLRQDYNEQNKSMGEDMEVPEGGEENDVES